MLLNCEDSNNIFADKENAGVTKTLSFAFWSNFFIFLEH